ncbi:MAG: hypothetical protein NTV93_07670 [Verrucomicrobia bacterium]|nr:hypothetical protein [Verrucomicrobiota bacterium]
MSDQEDRDAWVAWARRIAPVSSHLGTVAKSAPDFRILRVLGRRDCIVHDPPKHPFDELLIGRRRGIPRKYRIFRPAQRSRVGMSAADHDVVGWNARAGRNPFSKKPDLPFIQKKKIIPDNQPSAAPISQKQGGGEQVGVNPVGEALRMRIPIKELNSSRSNDRGTGPGLDLHGGSEE